MPGGLDRAPAPRNRISINKTDQCWFFLFRWVRSGFLISPTGGSNRCGFWLVEKYFHDPLFRPRVRPGSGCIEPVQLRFVFDIWAVALNVNASVCTVGRTYDRLRQALTSMDSPVYLIVSSGIWRSDLKRNVFRRYHYSVLTARIPLTPSPSVSIGHRSW